MTPPAPLSWLRLLSATLAIGMIAAGSVAAQTARDGRNSGGAQSGKANEAHAQWRRLTQTEVNCVDQALRARNSNLWSMIQRGVGPSDPAAAGLRAGCRPQARTQSEPAAGNVNQSNPLATPGRDTSRETILTSSRDTGRDTSPEYWNLNGSILNLVSEGSLRKFYYFQLDPRAQATGATQGALLLEGKVSAQRFLGTAYKYDSQCGRVPYRVDGMYRENNRILELQGQKPRVDANCTMTGTEMDSLALTAVDAAFAAAPGTAAEKPAVEKTAPSNVQEDKVAAATAAADRVTAAKATVEQTASSRPAADKAEADTALVEVAAIDKVAAGKAAAKKAAAEQATMEKAAAEKAAAEKAAMDKAAAERVAAEKAAADKAAADKAAAESKAAAERAAAERAAAEKAAAAKAAQARFAEPRTPELKTPAGKAAATTAAAERPQMELARADVERARADAAKAQADAEQARAEADKARAQAIYAGAAAESKVSFIYGLISGLVLPSACAFAFFFFQRRKSAQLASPAPLPTAAAPACESQSPGTQSEFDLLIRAVLAEANRIEMARLMQVQPEPSRPKELVPG